MNLDINATSTYSKSMPSRLYFLARFKIACAKDALLLAVDTTLEKYMEPVQPPIERDAFTP